MIDTSRSYILNLFDFFEKNPGSKERWVEDHPFRRGVVQKAKPKSTLDNDAVAAQLIYSLFLEQRTSDPVVVLEKVHEFLHDLKNLTSTVFMCEFTVNRSPRHHFVIQKTADSALYIYQSHAPYYKIEDSIRRLDKDPISFEALSTRLYLLTGSALTRSYAERVLKPLFHIPFEAPPLHTLNINYYKCPYKPFEPNPLIGVRYRISFSPLRFMITLTFLTFVYFAIRYFKETAPTGYVLEVKYNLPR